MIEQRHPSLRVTPVEVGEPIQWQATKVTAPTRDDGVELDRYEGQTAARGRWYHVDRVDDVWQAGYTTTVLGHGGERPHRVHLRYCQTADAAQDACQDAEHVRAWALLPEPARELLLGVGQTVPA